MTKNGIFEPRKRYRSIYVPWLPYNADIVYIVRDSLMQKWCKLILHCRNYRGLKFRHYYCTFGQKRDFWAQKRYRRIFVPWLPYNADIVYVVRDSLLQKWCKLILHCRNYRGLNFRHYYLNFDQKRDFWAQKKISQHICAMTSL